MEESYKEFEFDSEQQAALREVLETPIHVTRAYGSIGWHPKLTKFGAFFISGGPKVKRLWLQESQRPVRYVELGKFNVTETALPEFIETIRNHIRMMGTRVML